MRRIYSHIIFLLIHVSCWICLRHSITVCFRLELAFSYCLGLAWPRPSFWYFNIIYVARSLSTALTVNQAWVWLMHCFCTFFVFLEQHLSIACLRSIIRFGNIDLCYYSRFWDDGMSIPIMNGWYFQINGIPSRLFVFPILFIGQTSEKHSLTQMSLYSFWERSRKLPINILYT